MIKVIDTHAHLEMLTDLERVIGEAQRSGVEAIIGVGSDINSNNKILEISTRYPCFVFPALGFYPELIQPTNKEKNIRFIEENISLAVAIGEVGLDYHPKVKKKANKKQQKEVLEQIILLAKKYKKPLILHSRYAWRDVFLLVSRLGLEKAVFHWYSGPLSILKEILKKGYFISASPALSYSKAHQKAVVFTPLERIVLETDTPVPIFEEGNRFASRPKYVLKVLSLVSQLKKVSKEKVAEQTTKNSKQLFCLKI